MITAIALLVGSISKALMDASAHGKINHPFWLELEAWKNKWKNGDRAQGERFIGSSTVFVFLTSGWHLAQFVFLNSMFIALIFYPGYISKPIDFLILSVMFRVLFEGIYRIL